MLAFIFSGNGNAQYFPLSSHALVVFGSQFDGSRFEWIGSVGDAFTGDNQQQLFDDIGGFARSPKAGAQDP